VKEVIAVIRNERWQATREAVGPLDVQEICHQRVLGRGRQRGLRYLRPSKGGEVGGMEFLPKRMVVWLASDDKVDALVAALIRVNRGGNYGDGKIFVCPVEDAPVPKVDEAGTLTRQGDRR